MSTRRDTMPHRMTRSAPAGAESTVARNASRVPAGSAFAVAILALAGCTTLGNPAASDNDAPLYATSQSNLTSLSEVIDKHPEDPQAYNMRGAVYGEAGRNEQALADFGKAIGT